MYFIIELKANIKNIKSCVRKSVYIDNVHGKVMAEYVVLMFFIWAHFARIRYHNDCNNWENTSFQAIKIWSWLWIRFWNDTVVYIQIRFKILVWLRISIRIVNGLSVLSSSAQFPKIHCFVFKQETCLISFCVENKNSNKQLLVRTYIHWNISKCIRFRLCAQLSPTVDGVLCFLNVSPLFEYYLCKYYEEKLQSTRQQMLCNVVDVPHWQYRCSCAQHLHVLL